MVRLGEILDKLVGREWMDLLSCSSTTIICIRKARTRVSRLWKMLLTFFELCRIPPSRPLTFKTNVVPTISNMVTQGRITVSCCLAHGLPLRVNYETHQAD